MAMDQELLTMEQDTAMSTKVSKVFLTILAREMLMPMLNLKPHLRLMPRLMRMLTMVTMDMVDMVLGLLTIHMPLPTLMLAIQLSAIQLTAMDFMDIMDTSARGLLSLMVLLLLHILLVMPVLMAMDQELLTMEQDTAMSTKVSKVFLTILAREMLMPMLNLKPHLRLMPRLMRMLTMVTMDMVDMVLGFLTI